MCMGALALGMGLGNSNQEKNRKWDRVEAQCVQIGDGTAAAYAVHDNGDLIQLFLCPPEMNDE